MSKGQFVSLSLSEENCCYSLSSSDGAQMKKTLLKEIEFSQFIDKGIKNSRPTVALNVGLLKPIITKPKISL